MGPGRPSEGGISMIWPHMAPKRLGCTTGTHHSRESLLIERLGKNHNPLAMKILFVPFYYKPPQNCETSVEHRTFPEITSICRREAWLHILERYDAGPSPGDSVVTSLLKHLTCTHTKARVPAILLQKHRLTFCSLFLPGIGQQSSWPQLQHRKIQEAPWHQMGRDSRTRKQSPMPSTYPQEPPHCLVPHSPSACSVALL